MKKQFHLKHIESTSLLRKIEFDLSEEFKKIQFSIHHETHVLTIESEEDITEDQMTVIQSLVKKNSETSEMIEREPLPVFRKVLLLEGLDCANCSAKIERIAKRTFNYEMISVDFATTRFIIETTDQALIENLIPEVQKIVSMVDPAVVVKPNMKNSSLQPHEIKVAKKDIILFAIGALLFIFAVSTKYFLASIGFIIPAPFVVLTYAIAYVILGTDVLFGAFKNLVSKRFFDEQFLMTLATIVALAIGFYEEAVSVMIFYKIGMFFQEFAVHRSRKSIAQLIDIRPTVANLIVNREVVEVDPSDIIVGDMILVKMGEKIPVDGVVVDGEASLDVSALTGETKYLDVAKDDMVISGSVATNGTLKIQVSKNYEESMVSQILELVENANSLKSKSENFISKFAKYYTPIIVGLAFLLSISPLVFVRGAIWEDYQQSIYNAMIFLVISCPCALVISIPLGFFGGIGGASRHGILIKGSNYLEALSNTGSIIFDKTGTLTKGSFRVESIVAVDGNQEAILEMAAHCEMTSSHPIAKSITQAYGKDRLKASRIQIHPKSSKFGLRIFLDDVDIAVGNANAMEKIKVKIPDVITEGVVVYVAKDLEYVGHLVIQDEIRENAKETIEQLHKMGIRSAIFTGDKEDVARQVADEVGIKTVYAEMLPIDKVKKLRQLKRNLEPHQKQVYVGDGINDAPVLSTADVGIAMGNLGSDAAIKVADVVLMNDDLSKLPTAIRIARKTKMIVMQNIALALTVKIIVLSFASVGLSHMWEAIFADVGVSLIAIINSLRAANINKHK